VDSLTDIILWYVVWTLATIAFAPLVLVVFRNLADHGAVFVRALSALILVWPTWFLSGITGGFVPFTDAALWATIVVGGIGSWALAVRTGAIHRDALWHFGLSEVAYLVLFAGYVWFRGYDPTIQWQEKLSDLMLLASIMQAESIPPHDAWLAGETINYYYVGYVPWAGIGKLVGTTPAIAYNIALASVFASTVMAAIGVAANVVGRFHSLILARVSGALAAVFVMFMATPWATFTAIDRRDTIWNAFWYDWMWDASRQLEGGGQPAITEFPAFSFQLGDLHPHVLALPFTILALAAAWMLAIPPGPGEGGSLRAQWGRIVVAGGLCGGLYAMNSWDMPAYILIAILALLAGSGGWTARERLGAVGLLIVSAYVLWIPFHANFVAPTAPSGSAFADVVDGIPFIGSILASVVAWEGPSTTVRQYTGLFGYAWVVGIALVTLEVIRRRDDERDNVTTRIMVGVVAIVGLAGLLMSMPLLLLAAVPLLLITWLLMRDPSVSPANAALTLFGVGFALTLVPEFFYLLDIFNNRMNIVFKLYYQAWTIFAIGAAIGAVVLWQALRHINVARFVLPAVAAVMVIGGVGAAVVGTHQWVIWRTVTQDEGWIGMDGLHFLEKESGWAGEHDAITWLYENASPDDVMLSAGGCEFTLDIGTTSAGSGVPTILGWEGHEGQWHLGQWERDNQTGVWQPVAQRVEDINTLWATLDPALLDQYGVTLLYIGPQELRGPVYPDREVASAACAPGPFENASNPNFPGEGWTQVYSNEAGVRIYRRNDA
jgi:YYY domain-containing protein